MGLGGYQAGHKTGFAEGLLSMGAGATAGALIGGPVGAVAGAITGQALAYLFSSFAFSLLVSMAVIIFTLAGGALTLGEIPWYIIVGLILLAIIFFGRKR